MFRHDFSTIFVFVQQMKRKILQAKNNWKWKNYTYHTHAHNNSFFFFFLFFYFILKFTFFK